MNDDMEGYFANSHRLQGINQHNGNGINTCKGYAN